MAILATIALSENNEFEGAYLKINTPWSYKEIIEKEVFIKLAYDIEYYSEKGGALIKVEHNKKCAYLFGNVWEEVYSDLKSNYEKFENV